MRIELRQMARRMLLPLALATGATTLPGAPAVADPGGVPLGGGLVIEMKPGDIVTPKGLPVSIGTVVEQLGSTTAGYCEIETGAPPVGIIVAAGAAGMAVDMDITNDCRIVVSNITNHVADHDPADSLAYTNPGAGVPPTPFTTADAVPDLSVVLGDPQADTTSRIVRCRHEAWSKATMLDETNTTATETREQVIWHSSGRDQCYGRSVTNMVVNTAGRHTYCYSAWWQMSSHDGCYYSVDKSAPNDTSAHVWGEMQQQGSRYNLHAYNWAGLSTETPWVYKCFLTEGSIRRGSKLNCKGKQLT